MSDCFRKISLNKYQKHQKQYNKYLVVSKGILPAKQLATKIFMAVNYCGRQLAQRLGWAATSSKVGWAAPAYHKKEGAAQHPGARKHSLQYDWRSDGHVGLRGRM